MRIQHNIAALNTFRQLGINQGNQSKSAEKLSSGFRINRAADDAAGLSISEKMRSQIRGLNRASVNAQDGISMIQAAEGALQESHAILQRMRELAVQGANEVNAPEDRRSIKMEMDQLAFELDRIANSTCFNGKYILSGKYARIDNVRYEYPDNIPNYLHGDPDAEPIGPLNLHVGSNTLVSDVIQISLLGVMGWDLLTKDVWHPYMEGEDAGNGFISDPQWPPDLPKPTKNYDFTGWQWDGTAAYRPPTGWTPPPNLEPPPPWEAPKGWILTVPNGYEPYEDWALFPPNPNDGGYGLPAALGDGIWPNDGPEFLDYMDPTTHEYPQDHPDAHITIRGFLAIINIIDGRQQNGEPWDADMPPTGIPLISQMRSMLGATQNRLEHTIANIDTIAENMQNAESRMRDVDIPSEMMALTTSEILNNSATAMMAQANQTPEAVLEMLK